MPNETKGGNVELRSVDVPDTVRPGETYTVRATVANEAGYIGPFDPDICNSQGRTGYEIVVDFFAGDQTRSVGPDCLRAAIIGDREVEYSAVFVAPESGTVQAGANVVLPGSDKSTGDLSHTVTVSATAPESPDEPGDQSGGGPLFPGDGDEQDADDGPLSDPLGGVDAALTGIGGLVLVALLLVALSEAEEVSPG